MKQIVVVLGLIFNNKKQILLTKRDEPQTLYSHGKWQLPGGGIDNDEQPIQTLHREIKEEVGITVEVLSKTPFVYTNVHENTQLLLIGYPCLYSSGVVDISQDSESSEYKWVMPSEINYSDCLPFTKELIDDAIKFGEYTS